MDFGQKRSAPKKLGLTGSLHREVSDADKDWFGYINLPEESLEGFAELIRSSPRVENRTGAKVVRLKVYGWNRETGVKKWIKFVFG